MANFPYLGTKTTLFSAQTATGSSSAVPFTRETATIHVEGTFTATVLIEVSNDGGTTWQTAVQAGTTTAASFTAAGVAVILGPFEKLRARVSAYTSGSINVYAIH